MRTHIQKILIAIFAITLLIFVALRLYKLESSLLFFNDIGRDFWELEEWRETGLPPLLGPQTSALPFNQSAFYFYILYPGYLLSGLSPFSSVYTLLVFYIVLAVGFFAFFIKEKKYNWAWAVLLISILVALHPQAIGQNRFVWNPSFAFPSTLVALMAWFWGRRHWSWLVVAVWGLASAAAISFSYSVAPLLLLVAALTPFVYGFTFKDLKNWKSLSKSFWLLLSSTLAGAFLNLPTLAFELRHNFTLTNLMLHGQKLPQSGLEWDLKLDQLFHYLTGSNENHISMAVLVAFVLATGFGIYTWHSKKLIAERNRLLIITGIFLTTLWLTLVVPVSVQAHYIFGLVSATFVMIAFLPKRIAASFVLVAAAAWLQPPTLSIHYTPAFRTVAQMDGCFAQVCSSFGDEPIFVSVQAGFHPFHNGTEHRYLMKRAGCNVKIIERDPSTASYMAVVVDDSIYEHNKTAYNELTLFGSSVENKVYNCQKNFQVHLLEKLPSAFAETASQSAGLNR